MCAAIGVIINGDDDDDDDDNSLSITVIVSSLICPASLSASSLSKEIW